MSVHPIDSGRRGPEAHDLVYAETVTQQYAAKTDEDGNLILVGDSDIIEAEYNLLLCNECGPLMSDESLAAHGVSNEWQIAGSEGAKR